MSNSRWFLRRSRTFLYMAIGITSWLPWAWPSYWVVSVPKASRGRQEYFTSQAALHWCYYYGLEATFSFSLSLPRVIGTWGLPTALLPPWSFLPMGIGEPHGDRLCFSTILSWRRPGWATPCPGDASSWRCWHLASLRLGDALCWLWLSSRWLWPWLSQHPDTGRYSCSCNLVWLL